MDHNNDWEGRVERPYNADHPDPGR
jgi:hypothetical protein